MTTSPPSTRITDLHAALGKARRLATSGQAAVAGVALLDGLVAAALPLATALGIDPAGLDHATLLRDTCNAARARLDGVVAAAPGLARAAGLLDLVARAGSQPVVVFRHLVRVAGIMVPVLSSEATLRYLCLESSMLLAAGKPLPGRESHGTSTSPRKGIDPLASLVVVAWIACGWNVLAALGRHGIPAAVAAACWFGAAQGTTLLRRSGAGKRLVARWCASVPVMTRLAGASASLLATPLLPAITTTITHEGVRLASAVSLLAVQGAPPVLVLATWLALAAAVACGCLAIACHARQHDPRVDRAASIACPMTWLVAITLLVVVAWWTITTNVAPPFIPAHGLLVVQATPVVLLPAVAAVAVSS